MKICRTTILGFALLLAGLALCSAGLWMLLSPAQYRATVRIHVEEGLDDTRFNKLPDGGYVTVTNMFPTESAIIRSEAVLNSVISELNLNAAWGKRYSGGEPLKTTKSVALLRRRLSLTPVRVYDTPLISLSASSEDPEEAAKIANAVAMAYKHYTITTWRQRSIRRIQTLSEYLQQEDQDIKAGQEKLELLGKQLNLPTPQPPDDMLKSNFPAYFQAKQELQEKTEHHKLLAIKITYEKTYNKDWNPPMIVVIEDFAQPPKSPAGPNRPLGEALLAIGLLPNISGLFLLKTSRRVVCVKFCKLVFGPGMATR